MQVSELMSGEPAIVPATTTLEEAGARMVRLRIRHLPVVDAAGRLAGMITDHDVFRHGGFLDGDRAWLSYEPEYDRLTAGDLAAKVDVAVDPDEDLVITLRKMARSRQDFAVVVNGEGHPIGVLTEHDAVRVALDVLPLGLEGEHEGTSPVLTIPRDRPAKEALDAMITHGFRHLVVSEPDGAIFGVVSYGDLLADDASRRPELKAEDVVRSLQVRTVPRGTRLREIASILKRDAIGCLPIVDEKRRPVGIVTRRDVLEAAVAGLEADDLFPDG